MKRLIILITFSPLCLFAQRDSTKYLDSLCLPLQNRVKVARVDYMAGMITKAAYDAAVNAFILCRDRKNNYLRRKEKVENDRRRNTNN
jgi:hypothetical protein